MKNNLTPLLESVGFTEKESELYLALLTLGKGTVSHIAKQAKIKRPTAYLLLEGLTQKGFISELPGKNIKEYRAIDPAVVLIKKKTDLKNFSEMLPFLQTLRATKIEIPKIHSIDTKEGICNVYESLNYAKESLCISSYTKINQLFPGKVDFWIKGYTQKSYKIQTRHLIPDDPEEIQYGKRLQRAGQKIRILPFPFDTDIVITENKFSLSSLEENPFLILIESKKLIDTLKPLFEFLWASGKELD